MTYVLLLSKLQWFRIVHPLQRKRLYVHHLQENKENISYDGPKIRIERQILPLGIRIKDNKKNPANANNAHDDILRPKNFNNVIDKTRLARSTAPVAAT